MRRRASAIIIKDKRMLFVSDDGSWYWTPGGRIEDGEDYNTALEREIEEELGVSVKSMEHYTLYQYPEEDTVNFRAPAGEESCFITEIDENILPQAEIKIIKWATKNEILELPILQSMKENVIQKLIKDNYL